ncbi:MAG: hypothetical protein M0Z79_10415 [Nitrospiraceae bacterium]|nr:hypothetical protein [Nitrospiraceae bacterium]
MSRLRMILLFAAMVVSLVLLLRFLNWIPAAFQKTEVRRYRSIEDVRSGLKIRKVFLPSYFPQYLTWPPDEIFARKRPYPLVLMHFTNQQRGEIAMSIRQADVRDASPVVSRIEPVIIHSEENILIKDRPARLFIATCPAKRACISVMWQEEGYVFTITAKDSVREVTKIAESMLSEEPQPNGP